MHAIYDVAYDHHGQHPRILALKGFRNLDKGQLVGQSDRYSKMLSKDNSIYAWHLRVSSGQLVVVVHGTATADSSITVTLSSLGFNRIMIAITYMAFNITYIFIITDW